jgi:hypothetical protein
MQRQEFSERRNQCEKHEKSWRTCSFLWNKNVKWFVD